MCHTVHSKAKVLSALWNVCKEKSVSLRAKMGTFDGTTVQLVSHGCDVWAIDKNEKIMDVLEIKCVRKICNVRKAD